MKKKESFFLNPTPSYKIVLFGDSRTGKTQIINHVNNNEYEFQEKYYPTFGADYKLTTLLYNHYQYQLQLVEIAGKKEYSIDVTKNFLLSTKAFIIVFDISDLRSYIHVPNYLIKMETEEMDPLIRVKNPLNSEQITDANNNLIFTEREEFKKKILYIVGNKCDLPNRVCGKEEGEKHAFTLGGKYREVSAKTGMGIEELFRDILDDIKELDEVETKRKIKKLKRADNIKGGRTQIIDKNDRDTNNLCSSCCDIF